MKKTLVILLALTMAVSMLAVFPFAAAADEGDSTAVWSGKANIKWYLDTLEGDPNATEFHLATGEDLAGLAYLVNAFHDAKDRKTCYNGLWYDIETGDVLGFQNSGADAGYRFNYVKLGFYIPRPQEEGQTDGYTTTDGIYRPLYSEDDDIEDPIDGSAYIPGDQFYGKTIYLDADLVMNEGTAQDFENEKPANAWMPIGGGRNIDAVYSSFIGTFKGQGHTISGLYFSETEKNSDKVGLFGHVARGGTVTIQDIVLENCYFEGYREIGGLIGRTNGAVILFNCHVKNSIIKGFGEAGGMVGPVHNGAITFEQCSVRDIYVEAQRAVGALVSNVDWNALVVIDCLMTGTIRSYTVMADEKTTGGWDIGIILGRISQGSITVSHAISNVTVIQEAGDYQNENSAYTASAGVVYGAISKKNNTDYNPGPTMTIEGYYYVDKIQANGHVEEFPTATKIEQESDLTGTKIDRYVFGFDFDEVWEHGAKGELPYLKNTGKATDDEGGDTPPDGSEIDHISKHELFEDNWVNEKKASCETAGVKGHYHCSCGKDFDREGTEITDLAIPATGHAFGEMIPTKEATSEAEGEKAHYECSTCHKYFDENKVEISRADLVIPKVEKSGGCGGVIVGVPFVAVVVLGAAVLLRKKENESK